MCGYSRPIPVIGVALMASILWPATAQASSQGSLDGASTGSVVITASVPVRAQIAGLSDIAVSDQNPAGPAAATQSICLSSNTPSRNYTVTASGGGLAGDFVLSNGAVAVPYFVEWGVQSTLSPVSSGISSAQLQSPPAGQTCSSEAGSALLSVGIERESLRTMVSGEPYVGSLTVMLSPQ